MLDVGWFGEGYLIQNPETKKDEESCGRCCCIFA